MLKAIPKSGTRYLMQQIPMNNGDELDAFTKWRHIYHWKPGTLKKIKRGYNKRARKAAKKELLIAEASQ